MFFWGVWSHRRVGIADNFCPQPVRKGMWEGLMDVFTCFPENKTGGPERCPVLPETGWE